MKIKEMDKAQRPREKALTYGIQSLNNEELLCLIIRTGSSSCTVQNISKKVLDSTNQLASLFELRLSELTALEGVGEAKALTLIASMELARRSLCSQAYRISVGSAQDVAMWLQAEYGSCAQEHFVVLYLDKKDKLISHKVLSIGTIDQSVIHPREILREACLCKASSILLVHNHPSGDPTPSCADLETTRFLVNACEVAGIPVVDHIIVTNSGYFSFKRQGLLHDSPDADRICSKAANFLPASGSLSSLDKPLNQDSVWMLNKETSWLSDHDLDQEDEVLHHPNENDRLQPLLMEPQETAQNSTQKPVNLSSQPLSSKANLCAGSNLLPASKLGDDSSKIGFHPEKLEENDSLQTDEKTDDLKEDDSSGSCEHHNDTKTSSSSGSGLISRKTPAAMLTPEIQQNSISGLAENTFASQSVCVSNSIPFDSVSHLRSRELPGKNSDHSAGEEKTDKQSSGIQASANTQDLLPAVPHHSYLPPAKKRTVRHVFLPDDLNDSLEKLWAKGKGGILHDASGK